MLPKVAISGCVYTYMLFVLSLSGLVAVPSDAADTFMKTLLPESHTTVIDLDDSSAEESRYIIELKQPSVLEQRVDSLQSRSSQVLKGSSLRARSTTAEHKALKREAQNQRQVVESEQNSFLSRLQNHAAGKLVVTSSQFASRTQNVKANSTGKQPLVVHHRFSSAVNGMVVSGVDETTLERIKADSAVKHVYKDKQVRAVVLETTPVVGADVLRNYQDSHGNSLTGKGIRVGIVDTGIDYNHPDFGACYATPGCQIAGGYDFHNNDSDPYDDHSHGTHVASIVASNGYYTKDGSKETFQGIAPDATLYAFKVLGQSGSGSSSNVIRGIEACGDPNADGDYSDHLDVCNLSLGSRGGSPEDATSLAVDRVTKAVGVIFAIAAGNSGPREKTIGSPGASREAVTVGASCLPRDTSDGNCNGGLANFSSRGPVIWNSGGQTHTLNKPDVVAPGYRICAAAATVIQSKPSHLCLDDIHARFSGTSMASPVVAGVLALLRQIHPEMDAETIKRVLLESARPFGLGINKEGHGQVDALAALKLMGGSDANLSIEGLPIFIDDENTSEKAEYTRTITVKNITSQARTYDLISDVPAGVSVVMSPEKITLEAGAKADIQLHFVVDHTLSRSGRQLVDVIMQPDDNSRNRVIQATLHSDKQSELDTERLNLGVVSPDNAQFSISAQIQLSNLMAFEKDYQLSLSLDNLTGIKTDISPVNFSLQESGTRTVTVSLSGTTDKLGIGHHHGFLLVHSGGDTIRIPVTFAKGYAVYIKYPNGETPLKVKLALENSQDWSTHYNHQPFPGAEESIIYTRDKGPYAAIAEWSCNSITCQGDFANSFYFYMAEGIEIGKANAITIGRGEVNNKVTMRWTDSNGKPFFIQPFHALYHKKSGLLVEYTIGIGTGLKEEIVYFNDISDAFTYNFVATQTPTEYVAHNPKVFTYHLANGIDQDMELLNTASDVRRVPLYGLQTDADIVAYVIPYMYNGNKSVRNMDASPRFVHTYPVGQNGVTALEFYTYTSQKLEESGYMDHTAIRFFQELPELQKVGRPPISSLPKTKHTVGTTAAARIFVGLDMEATYTRQAVGNYPEDAWGMRLAPVVDMGRWINHSTLYNQYQPRRTNYGYYAHGDGSAFDYLSGTVPYTLYFEGEEVHSGVATRRSFLTVPTAQEGHYRATWQRSLSVGGQDVEVSSTYEFTLGGVNHDANPPFFKGVHILGDGVTQAVVDTDLSPQVWVEIDPGPGTSSATTTGNGKGLIHSEWMQGDRLTDVSIEQSHDGQRWQALTIQPQDKGVYIADIASSNDRDLYYFRVVATDVAGNKMQQTFVAPAGKGLSREQVYGQVNACIVSDPTINIIEPQQSGVIGQPRTYEVSITNNNSATCPEHVFSLGFNGRGVDDFEIDAADTLSIASGETNIFPVRFTPTTEARIFNYEISVSVKAHGIQHNSNRLYYRVLPEDNCATGPRLTIDARTKTVEPGGSRQYTVFVHNQDIGDDCKAKTFALSGGSSTLVVQLDKQSLTLAQGVTGEVDVMVTSRTNHKIGSSYDFSVTAAGADGKTHSVGALLWMVEETEPECIRRNPVVSVDPESQKAGAGESLDYGIKVTNRDSANCAARRFTLSVVDGLLTSTLLRTTVALEPQTSSTGLSVTIGSAKGLAAGNYDFLVIAEAGSAAGSGKGQLVVEAAPQCVTNRPVVQVKPDSKTAKAGEPVNYELQVTSTDGEHCAARSFALSVVDGPLTSVLSHTTVALEPKQSSIGLNVTIGSEKDLAAGDYDFLVVAQGGGETGSNKGRLVIEKETPQCERKPLGVRVSAPSEQTGEPGSTLSYTVTITNNNQHCDDLQVNSQAVDLIDGFSVQGLGTFTLGTEKPYTQVVTITSSVDQAEGDYGFTLQYSAAANGDESTHDVTYTVEKAQQACTRGAPSLEINPSVQKGGFGQLKVYEVTLTNNDKGECESINYTLKLSKQKGFVSGLQRRTAELKPGERSRSRAYVMALGAGKGDKRFEVEADEVSGDRQASNTFIYQVTGGRAWFK